MKISPPLNSSKAWSLLKTLLIIDIVVVLLSVWAGIKGENLQAYFAEESLVTWLSGLQLLVTGGVSMALYRRRYTPPWSWRSPALIWLVIALGFIFLAADELLEIHEQLDKWIHTVGNIQETALTDRIDDVIVGLYGIIAAGLLYTYRRELNRYRSLLPLIVVSFILLFMMVFVDVLTNRPDVLPLFLEANVALIVQSSLEVLEELCKLMVGSLFLGGIYRAFQIEKQWASADL